MIKVAAFPSKIMYSIGDCSQFLFCIQRNIPHHHYGIHFGKKCIAINSCDICLYYMRIHQLSIHFGIIPSKKASPTWLHFLILYSVIHLTAISLCSCDIHLVNLLQKCLAFQFQGVKIIKDALFKAKIRF